MGESQLNAEQRRLAALRALRQEHYPVEDALENELAEKDRRIAELERENELLRLKLSRTPETRPPSKRRRGAR